MGSYPASWDALRKALYGMPPEAVRDAINAQLMFQPSGEVYDFLTQTLDFAMKRIDNYLPVPTPKPQRRVQVVIEPSSCFNGCPYNSHYYDEDTGSEWTCSKAGKACPSDGIPEWCPFWTEVQDE